MKYITIYGLESLVEYCVDGANTIQDLNKYLSTDPQPEYRLASCQLTNNGYFIVVWEKC